MRPSPPQLIPSLTRRRVLQGTLSGVAGLTAWQPGWPWHRTATAQHRERACSHFSGQASSRARCEVAICFNRFHRPAL